MADSFLIQIFHLRDLCCGNRTRIKSTEVKHLGVPLFEGLSTSDILEWASRYPQVAKALPVEQREIEKMLRQTIINIVYTLVGQPFKVWVD